MPVDPSLAWGRIIIPYTTTLAEHKHTIHIRELDSEGNWLVPSSGEDTVFDTLNNYLSNSSFFIPTGTLFSGFTIMKNDVGALPATFWMTGAVPTLDTAPSGTLLAGNQITISYRTPTNRPVKHIWLDCNAGIPVPWLRIRSGYATDLLALAEYVEGNANIVSIDGEDIQRGYAATGVSNATLERRYAKKARSA